MRRANHAGFMNAGHDAVTLTEQLQRLTEEVDRLERRIADGEGGIEDHILLQATLRTQARTRRALVSRGVGWVVPVSASAPAEAVRPRNVAQLFATSTHRQVRGVF